MRICEQQRKELKTDDFIVIKDIIPKYSVDRALRAINEEIGEDGLPQDIFGWGMNCKSAQTEDVMALLYHTPLWLICRELINEPEGRGCQVALRFPSGDYHSWTHLDGVYEGDEENLDSFTAIIGIPLSPVTEMNSGELIVYPSSVETLRGEYFASHDFNTIVPLTKHIGDRLKPQHVLMDVGDAVLMNSFMLHNPGANFSPNIRYAVYFRINAKGHVKGWHNLNDPWHEWNLGK